MFVLCNNNNSDKSVSPCMIRVPLPVLPRNRGKSGQPYKSRFRGQTPRFSGNAYFTKASEYGQPACNSENIKRSLMLFSHKYTERYGIFLIAKKFLLNFCCHCKSAQKLLLVPCFYCSNFRIGITIKTIHGALQIILPRQTAIHTNCMRPVKHL